tara:strand:+ start:553 stop:873 length:321 start_codon:yes stop_codon:yes gene_type:complete
MAITYTWDVEQLECIPKVGNKVNVVEAIPYNYVGVDDSDNTKGVVSGELKIQTSDLSDWTAYSSLSKADIEGWLEANLTVADLKTKVDAIIDAKQNPASIMVAKPW